MEFERAREDLLVAVTGASATILLTIGSNLIPAVSAGTAESLAPLGVYAAYRFSRKGGPYGDLDTARNWAILTGVVGVVALVLAAT